MNLLNDKNHYYFQKTEYYSLLKNRYLGLFVFLCFSRRIDNVLSGLSLIISSAVFREEQISFCEQETINKDIGKNHIRRNIFIAILLFVCI